jgi:hypothetical protein
LQIYVKMLDKINMHITHTVRKGIIWFRIATSWRLW